MISLRLGIDFGGTKIEIAALDAVGKEHLRRRVPNPGGYDAAIRVVRDLVCDAEAEVGCTALVGIATPGSESPRTGLMRNANSVWLNGRPFKTDVQAALGREIRMANDANCLVLSEALDGAAAGAHSAFGVIIGTGCGGGLVIDGKIVEGATHIAGEFGHVPLPWPEPHEYPGSLCWCGKHGCLETWVSGTGFQQGFAARTGRKLAAADIVAAARAGSPEEKAALDAYVDRLARGLALVANIVDPDCFVLGGGMSNVAELYEALPARVRRYAFTDVWASPVVPAKWGDSSGVRGAAMLWG